MGRLERLEDLVRIEDVGKSEREARAQRERECEQAEQGDLLAADPRAAGSGLQTRARTADGPRMSLRTRIGSCVLLVAMGGCLMPAKGTAVFVDMRAGKFWSGRGVLLEVSPDKTRCKVAVRDRALIVHKPWVDCRWVHARNAR
jgi:hypothetical protein